MLHLLQGRLAPLPRVRTRNGADARSRRCSGSCGIPACVTYRWFERDSIHSLETGDRSLLVCLRSLARVRGTKTSAIGGGVVFDNNELLQLFSDLRVVRYEDTDAIGDFGGRNQTRVVRFAAVKP